jgi:hypothetical protein
VTDWIHGSRAPSGRLAAMELAVLRKKMKIKQIRRRRMKGEGE